MNRRTFLQWIPKAGAVAAALPFVATTEPMKAPEVVQIPDALKATSLSPEDSAPYMNLVKAEARIDAYGPRSEHFDRHFAKTLREHFAKTLREAEVNHGLLG